jgi:8-oxo-dGTP diphosphatase
LSSNQRIVDVAAAVILRDDGSFLLGRRPPGTAYAGWWEFPGGKVEVGETAYEAMVRELAEELGIVVERAYPWIMREHVYEHAHVRIHFFRVVAWSGELRDLQHDALEWQAVDAVTVTPMLPANAPVLAALGLPDVYAASMGVDAQLTALTRALAGGLRLVQLREPGLPLAQRAAFVHAAVALCHGFGARVLVNGDLELARESGADGVHLPALALMAARERPDCELVAASCHDRNELEQAGRLGVDFVVCGPLRATPSHPGQAGIGWGAFAELARNLPMPVYALGGTTRDDLPMAWSAGAHGIAAIRGAWID